VHGSRSVDSGLLFLLPTVLVEMSLRRRVEPFTRDFQDLLLITGIKTVILANLDKETREDILNSISGIIFLGSPLRGSPLHSIGSVIAKTATIFGYGDAHLLKDLDAQERSLIDLLKDFSRLANTLSIRVFCFYEQHKTEWKGRFGLIYSVTHTLRIILQSADYP